jgi:histidinol-phosphatase
MQRPGPLRPDEDLERLRTYAVDLARRAGDVTLGYFRGDLEVETKADETPVTRADRESELLIRERLVADHPEDGILGEEYGTRDGDGRRTWVIDPIDGTKSFVAGVPLYAVLVALVEGRYDGGEMNTDRVLLGVIHIPPLAETVSAARGCGAIWESQTARRRPIRSAATVSQHPDLQGARVCTSDFADLRRLEPGIARSLDEHSALSRTWGDAYGYLLVATGRIDIMIDPVVSPWDIAPLPVILEEAGGRFSALDGRAILGANALATNGRLHDEVLSCRGAP